LKDVKRYPFIITQERPSPYFVQPKKREEKEKEKNQRGEKARVERRGERVRQEAGVR